jgi:hypothetical protein
VASREWNRRGLIAGFGVGAAGLLTGCTGNFSFNYRLTITVMVDGRLISSSAVRRLNWHERIGALESLDTSGFRTRGDAVVVDLGQRGLLFATLATEEFDPKQRSWVFGSKMWTPVAAFDRAFDGGVDFWRRRSGVVVPLKRAEMPLLVTFADPRDRITVRRVDPEDLAATFGPSVKLDSITVEVTHAPVTRGQVQHRLAWLADVGSSRLERISANRPPRLAQLLYGYHFSLGNG